MVKSQVNYSQIGKIMIILFKREEVLHMKNRLKEERMKKSLSLEQVGKGVGLATNTISRYETGKREPKLETWQKLADFFGVSVPYLQGIQEYSLPNKFQPYSVSEDHFNYKISNNISENYIDQINNVMNEVYTLGSRAIAGDKKAQTVLNEIGKIISNNDYKTTTPLVTNSIETATNINDSRNWAGTINVNSMKRQLGGSLSFKPLGLTFGKHMKSNLKVDTDVVHKK